MEEDRNFAESAGRSWSWYFMDPSNLHARTNVAALIREMCGGVQTGVSTDGARPGVDWPERPESVKSGSTPVRGPVKSGRKRMKEKGRGLDKGLVRPELRPIGFNDKGVER